MKVINCIDPSYVSLGNQYSSDVNVLIDCSILHDDEHDNTIALLMEPNQILSYYLNNTVDVFSSIKSRLLSGDHRFRKLYTPFRYFKDCPNTFIIDHTPLPSWISLEESGIHEKSNDLTFITSTKGWTLQQIQRVYLADWFNQIGVPVYGKGYKEIERKASVLTASRFCVCVENENLEGYHTEKLVDCFKTGTIPLYVGDPKVSEKYEQQGIFQFNTVDELKNSSVLFEILNGHAKNIYESKKKAIVENYNRYLSYEHQRKGEFVFDMIDKDTINYARTNNGH